MSGIDENRIIRANREPIAQLKWISTILQMPALPIHTELGFTGGQPLAVTSNLRFSLFSMFQTLHSCTLPLSCGCSPHGCHAVDMPSSWSPWCLCPCPCDCFDSTPVPPLKCPYTWVSNVRTPGSHPFLCARSNPNWSNVRMTGSLPFLWPRADPTIIPSFFPRNVRIPGIPSARAHQSWRRCSSFPPIPAPYMSAFPSHVRSPQILLLCLVASAPASV